MKTRQMFRRGAALFLCALLFLAQCPIIANAQSDCVIIYMGAPSVWSMGQAHYLLTKMHRDNRQLTTKMPTPDALDPNVINSTRIQVLKTLLDLQAQIDQKLSVENRAQLQEFERKLADRNTARTELIGVTAQLQVLDSELATLKKDQARQQVELEQKKKKISPPEGGAQPDEINKLEQDIAVRAKEIELKEAQRAELVARKTAFETAAAKDVTPTGLANVGFDNTTAQLPGFTSLGNYLEGAAGQVNLPRLAATLALDNFIGMQYEIIAKQLTLLRDEVGRDLRIIFLELPASIYTVAERSDNYVAQVRWEIKNYAESSDDIEEELLRSEEEKRRPVNIVDQLRSPGRENKTPESKRYQEQKEAMAKPKKDEERKACVDDGGRWKGELCWKIPNSSYVRALDIIPHQSSLIVNDVQATTRYKNFLGGLKLLSGFGLKFNYQRQKELYEQFLQQETFAAGFGKGMTTFGWTFGPQPGAKRIAPGVRTMYAVLVVPQRTKALELEAKGIAYHREKKPDYNSEHQLVFPHLAAGQPLKGEIFKVIVPNVETSYWYANRVNYTPAVAGETATVVIRGQGFSAQTSVLVDGVALKSVHSIGNSSASEAGDDNAAGNVRGQFEVVNTQMIVTKFAMGDRNYIGTPTITIVAPEKSAAINPLCMEEINDARSDCRLQTTTPLTLRNASLKEPIFIERFALDRKFHDVEVEDGTGFVRAKLKGSGLRPAADIWVGDELLDDPDGTYAVQTDSKEYVLRFRKPTGNNWHVRFRQPTVRGFEVDEFDHPYSRNGEVDIFRYVPNPKTHKASLVLVFWGETPPDETDLIEIPGSIKQPRAFTPESSENDREVWRVTFEVPYEDQGGRKRVERDRVSFRVGIKRANAPTNGPCAPLVCDYKTTVLDLPIRPRIDSIEISAPLIPDDKGSVITIKGINMQRVVKVFIADQEAELTAPPNQDSVTVRLAKGTFIKGEKGVIVPVRVVTKDGTTVSATITIN